MTAQKGLGALRMVPLGGLGEIGMNCMIFEYEDEIFVLDCGVLFSDLQMLGVDFYIPDFTYLKDRKEKIRGYVLTHGHEDHIGALPYALRQCPAPIYGSSFALQLVRKKLEEHQLLGTAELIEFNAAESFKFKHFEITPYFVNHSIVEAFSLFIQTPQGLVVHTGDFKIDPSPYYGYPLDPKPFIAAGDKGVRLLMSDSTNVERKGMSPSEEIVYHKLKELVAQSKALTVISMFASNVGRMGQVVEVCKKLGKKLALLGRSMEVNAKAAFELGYLEGLYDVLIPADSIGSYLRNEVVVLSTGSQGEYRSGLYRVAQNEHKHIKLIPGDTVIMSSSFIPGNEKPIGRMINMLFRLGADVIYESSAQVHVSGHATADELALMMQYTRPEHFVPVHGEYRHLVKHKRLSEKNGIAPEKSIVAGNGDVIELTSEGLRITEHFGESRIMIEGATSEDVTKVTLKDRRMVAETGIVFAVIVRNSVTGDIMAGPDLMSRGFLEEGTRQDLIDDAKEAMANIIDECVRKSERAEVDMQEEVRIGLRRFFNNRIGKKPVVMVIVVEI